MDAPPTPTSTKPELVPLPLSPFLAARMNRTISRPFLSSPGAGPLFSTSTSGCMSSSSSAVAGVVDSEPGSKPEIKDPSSDEMKNASQPSPNTSRTEHPDNVSSDSSTTLKTSSELKSTREEETPANGYRHPLENGREHEHEHENENENEKYHENETKKEKEKEIPPPNTPTTTPVQPLVPGRSTGSLAVPGVEVRTPFKKRFDSTTDAGGVGQEDKVGQSSLSLSVPRTGIGVVGPDTKVKKRTGNNDINIVPTAPESVAKPVIPRDRQKEKEEEEVSRADTPKSNDPSRSTQASDPAQALFGPGPTMIQIQIQVEPPTKRREVSASISTSSSGDRAISSPVRGYRTSPARSPLSLSEDGPGEGSRIRSPRRHDDIGNTEVSKQERVEVEEEGSSSVETVGRASTPTPTLRKSQREDEEEIGSTSDSSGSGSGSGSGTIKQNGKDGKPTNLEPTPKQAEESVPALKSDLTFTSPEAMGLELGFGLGLGLGLGVGVGDQSVFLPDTPGNRKHAWMLEESQMLTRTPMQLGDSSVLFFPEDREEVDFLGDENNNKKKEQEEEDARETVGEMTLDLNFVGSTSMLGSDLLKEGKEMMEALGKVDMTMIGDETRMEGLPPVRMGRGKKGMSPVIEVPTPRPEGTVGRRSPVKRHAITTTSKPTSTVSARSGLLVPPTSGMGNYETLDLKALLQQTKILPKDMYGVGKDGKPEWRGDISVSELMKEDNPFIATAEEMERASRRIRMDGHGTLFHKPTAQAGPSRTPGQSLRNIFGGNSPGSPTKVAPEPNEVERELANLTNSACPSRLVFQLDPTLSQDGLKRVGQQAKADESRGTKLKAWEDAKRWAFVVDNMAWAKKMQGKGLLQGEDLMKVLTIIYEETPMDPGAGIRCPATPVFVKDARRLHPAQTTIRQHRRSASMDPAQTGTITGARSRLPSSGQDAARAIGHRRNATMDPSQVVTTATGNPSRARLSGQPTVEARKPGTMGSGVSRFGNTTRAASIGTKTSPAKATTRPSVSTRPTNPGLGQSRTRTNGTNADQVLASMGIREPISRTSRIVPPGGRASTNSSAVGRSRISSSTAAPVGPRASTTASSIITGRNDATTTSTGLPPRARMTQPSASGVERTLRRPSDALGQDVKARQAVGTTSRLASRVSSTTTITTSSRVERNVTSSRLPAGRSSTRALP